ncbi:MAG: TonB-dependent receptor [Verrucomicrobia bacterium]|nr:TonB-dependent receptor [Verrucomicrobiota bacterium]
MKRVRRVTWPVAIATVSLCVVASAQEESPVYEMEEFVVRGAEFDAIRAAITNQRQAENIKNVVDAGAFGDITEGNVGEFLKFLPGISVDFVSADVRSVSVRGLASNFTAVTMDGNRMASAASSSSSRTFEFEQVSLNNVARIEVVKVPTPAMEADSLGGAVNMVSRNAFELAQRKFDYRVFMNVPGDYIRWSRTPGPDAGATRKIRPGFDFTYSDPLTDDFGIVINYMNAETFTPQQYFITQWDSVNAAIGQSDPYLRYFNLRDGPKISERESLGIKADWRIRPGSIFSFGYQRNEYSTTFFNREVRWETSTSAGNYGPTFTNPNPNINPNGRFRHQVTAREKSGQTNHVDMGMKHYFDQWELTYDGYYSKSENQYRDTDNGYFERVIFRTPANLAIHFNDIGNNGPASVTTRRAGAEIDPFPLTDDTVLESLRSRPEDASDTIYGGKFDLTRHMDVSGNRLTLQTGMLYRQQKREIERREFNYPRTQPIFNQVGPGSSFFRDENYVGQRLGWGWPAPEWPDSRKVFQYFQANPDHFFFDEVANVIYNEENRQQVEEEVTAAYLMGRIALMNGRLRILGGVRYERTSNSGEGYARDDTVIYERNPDGSFRLINPFLGDNPQNRVLKPEFAGPDTPANLARRIRAQYAQRQTSKSSYDDFYPSLHFTYEVNERLQARLAYARTLGRPDISDLAPGIRFTNSREEDETGEERFVIEAFNPNLTAYSGDNFDISLEYYFDTGGLISVGAFYKQIKGFIDNETVLLTQDLADQLGIDAIFVQQGWLMRRPVNAGDVTIKGLEFAFVQDLGPWVELLDGFSVFANTTILTTRGDYGASQNQLVDASYVPGFIKQTANWGITYDKGRWDIRLKWNLRGKQMRDTGDIRGVYVGNSAANPSFWNRYYDRRLTTDLNIEYRFARYLRVFLNGRNIFDEPTDQLRYGVDTPDYAKLERRERFGALWTVGVKGTF